MGSHLSVINPGSWISFQPAKPHISSDHVLQYCPKRKNSEWVDQKKLLANRSVEPGLWRWRPLRLRSRTLQPLTAPSPRDRAAPPWPARTIPARPISALVREAVRVPQNRLATHAPRRHPCGCRRSATWSPASNRSTSIANATCVPSDSCLAQVGLRAESHSKKTIQNLIGRRNFLAGACSSQSASQITAAAIRPRACTPPRLLHAPRDAMPVPCALVARRGSAAPHTALDASPTQDCAAACCTPAPLPAPPPQQW